MVEIDFWSPYIGEDYIFVVAYCDSCCIERTKFVAEPSLKAIDKPKALLES